MRQGAPESGAQARPPAPAAPRPLRPQVTVLMALFEGERFLRELRPTLDDLETVAAEQTPALRDLRASADDLEDLLERLGPFADAATPAPSAS